MTQPDNTEKYAKIGANDKWVQTELKLCLRNFFAIDTI